MLKRKLFIDACVFVSFLFEEKLPKGKKATAFLDDLVKGKFDGVISPLILMEIVTAGRRILSERTNKNKKRIENDVSEALKSVFLMPNLDLVPSSETEIDFVDVTDNAFSYLGKYPGKIVADYTKGKKTKSGRTHAGMYGCDVMHLAMAKEVKCDELVSFDGDFKDVQEGIAITIL